MHDGVETFETAGVDGAGGGVPGNLPRAGTPGRPHQMDDLMGLGLERGSHRAADESAAAGERYAHDALRLPFS